MVLAPPPGVFPINIRGVTCQKYGLKIGEGINDWLKYKHLSKVEILNEIQQLGVTSDFEPGKKLIEAYPNEEILFFVDLQETYGEMILFCSTVESEMAYLDKFQNEEKEAEEKAAKDAQPIEEVEEDLSHIVYDDKPIISRPWKSDSSLATETEIIESSLNGEPAFAQLHGRRRLSIAITRPKSSCLRPVNFSSQIVLTQKIKSVPLRTITTVLPTSDSTEEPSVFLRLLTRDTACQAAPTLTEAAVQTASNKPVNKAIQYQSQTSTSSNTEPNINLNSLSSSFPHKVQMMISALIQNETHDILRDTFALCASRLNGHDSILEDTSTGCTHTLFLCTLFFVVYF
jgi:hypothetical protein